MSKESDILKIVKEDILGVCGEEDKKISLKSVKSKLKVSDLFISKAIKELEKEGSIKTQRNFILLTKKGREDAENIIRNHLVIENYFKERKSEEEAHKAAHILEHYVSEEVINNIKKLSTFKEKGIPLTELKLRKESLIADITLPSNGLFERIVSMGIYPGEKIKVVYKIPDGVVVDIVGKKFALGEDIAKKIMCLN